MRIETSLEQTGGLAMGGVAVAIIGVALEWMHHSWPYWGGYLIILGAWLSIAGLWGIIRHPTYLVVDGEGIHAPRQIDLVPWNQVLDIYPLLDLEKIPYLVVRVRSPDSLPTFSSGRSEYFPKSHRIGDDEIAISLWCANLGDRNVEQIVEEVKVIHASEYVSVSPNKIVEIETENRNGDAANFGRSD